jgi:hypothetical protein
VDNWSLVALARLSTIPTPNDAGGVRKWEVARDARKRRPRRLERAPGRQPKRSARQSYGHLALIGRLLDASPKNLVTAEYRGRTPPPWVRGVRVLSAPPSWRRKSSSGGSFASPARGRSSNANRIGDACGPASPAPPACQPAGIVRPTSDSARGVVEPSALFSQNVKAPTTQS